MYLFCISYFFLNKCFLTDSNSYLFSISFFLNIYFLFFKIYHFLLYLFNGSRIEVIAIILH